MAVFTSDDIFATAPPSGVNQVVPTPEEIALGFPGGTAIRPFFNAVVQKHSLGILTAQTLAIEQKQKALFSKQGLDEELIYVDDFAGTLNTDVRNKTPIFGANLRNDGGLINQEYRIGAASKVFKQSASYLPVYTDCAQTSSLLQVTASVSMQLSRFSSQDDKFGICFNCTGAFQRTEVAIVLNSSGQLVIKYSAFNTTGAELTTQSWPIENYRSLVNGSFSLTAGDLKRNGSLCVSMPDVNLFLDTGISVTAAKVSNSHGFVLSPKSFLLNSMLIKTL